ncbi:MAG: ECF-type sigma factor, partial [Phycisphaerales bacterium]
MKRRTKRSSKRDRAAVEAVSNEPAPISRERPVLELIQKLRSGSLQASLLDAEDRRACVEHLTAEGYSVAETAQILGVSDRTVTRDRNRIRAQHVLERDETTVDAMIGRLMGEYEASTGRLKRIARDRAVAAGTRVEAERVIWSAMCELVRLLQRLGYLPEAARELRADITCRTGLEELPSSVELEAELERLSAVPGAQSAVGPLLESLRERLAV